jgi:electron transfer flavoprotein alpha/beta subunit
VNTIIISINIDTRQSIKDKHQEIIKWAAEKLKSRNILGGSAGDACNASVTVGPESAKHTRNERMGADRFYPSAPIKHLFNDAQHALAKPGMALIVSPGIEQPNQRVRSAQSC